MSQNGEVQAAYTDVKLEMLQSHFLQGDEDSAVHFDEWPRESHHILCLRFDSVESFHVLSMLKMDDETRAIPVLTYTTDYEGSQSANDATDLLDTELLPHKPAARMN